MITVNETIEIGKFLKTHGLKGELNAQLEIDAEFLTMPDVAVIVDVDGILVPFFIESVRPKGHFSSLVKIENVDSEEDARSFVNKIIRARHEDVKAFEDEYDSEDGENEENGAYADDFIGFTIKLAADGQTIGEITDLDLSTANALFVVGSPGGENFLIPASGDFITEADMENHILTMDLPEGLLEVNSR